MNSIRRAVRALRVFSRKAESRLGLSGAQLFVLHSLGEEGSASINELAERTLTHQSSVSAVVTRLVGRGWVSRSMASGDARKSIVSLTREGRALLRRAPKTPQERLVDGISRLSSSHREQLARLLDEMLEKAGLADEPASLFFEELGTGKMKGKKS